MELNKYYNVRTKTHIFYNYKLVGMTDTDYSFEPTESSRHNNPLRIVVDKTAKIEPASEHMSMFDLSRYEQVGEQ
jgi:hypothetical protein